MTGWRNVPDPGEEYPVVDKMLIIKLMNYPTPHPNAREQSIAFHYKSAS